MSDEDYFGSPAEPEEQPPAPLPPEPDGVESEYPDSGPEPAQSRKFLAVILATVILLVIAATGYILYKQAQDLKTPAHKTNSVIIHS